MAQNYADDLPPSPSPSPRLRRSPKRQALHERARSVQNEVFRPTIRAVDNPDLKVYAKSPFPTSDAQRFPPRGRKLDNPTNFGVSPSNTIYATANLIPHDRSSLINAPDSPTALLRTHDGQLPPSSAQTNYPPSPCPPAEAKASYDSLSPSSIDVDRLAMDAGPNNANNDRERERPTRLTPNPPVEAAAARSGDGLLQPPSPHTPGRENRASLGAIASVASGLQVDDSTNATPMSVGSAASSGTVIRRRGFNGPTPPGFYTLFPPAPRPQSGNTRYARSSSEPPRPLTMSSTGSMSPISSGSASPISPVSPDNGSARPIYSTPAHARSDPVIESPGDVRYSVDIPSRGSSMRRRNSADSVPDVQYLQDPRFTIPRRPVGRSNAVRWNSYMSTIQSEPEEQASDIGQRSSSGAAGSRSGPSQQSSMDFSRLSSPFPLPDALIVGRRASGQRVTSGSSTIRVVSAQFKDLPALPQSSERRSVSDPSSGRVTSGRKLSARRPSSPSSIYSRPEYRDSGAQTDASVQTSSNGVLYRDSIPGWARYSLSNFFTRVFSSSRSRSNNSRSQVSRTPVSHHSSPSSNVNVSSTSPINDPICQSCGRGQSQMTQIPHQQSSNISSVPVVKIDSASIHNDNDNTNTNNLSRSYYANETMGRQTIGNPRDSDPLSAGNRSSDPQSLYIPRNRPRDTLRESMLITPVVDSNGRVIAEIFGEPRTHYQEWSPRLLHDRRSMARRRTVYIAPSIDEEGEGKGFTRRNVQLWCFALGFIFPPAWILAAFLPLPPNQRTPPPSPGFEHDLEKTLGPSDQARYENARWWRNVNRIMSVVGIGVIVAIVSTNRVIVNVEG